MKLEDWPFETYDDRVLCAMPGDGAQERVGNITCAMPMLVDVPGGAEHFTAGTFGQLARSIVEHAKDDHLIEIERSGSWYESYTPDGKLWAGSSSVGDFKAVDLNGMEGEELEHWTAHNAGMAELTYRRIGTYMVDVVEEWSP